MHLRQTVPVAGLLASLALSAPAWSQPAKAPREAAAEAMTEQARKLYLEGVKAFSQARWAEARAAFVGALSLHYHYTTVGNLGSAELRLGDYRSAAQHLAEYVRLLEQDAGATAKERAEGRAELDKARAKVGALVLRVDVDRATVFLVGERVLGTTPLLDPLFLEPGTHSLLIERDGYVSEPLVVSVAAGGEIERAVSLKKRPEPRTSMPAAEPRHDDQPPERGPRTALLIGGASVAGAAAVAGVVLTILAVSKGSDADAQRDALARENAPSCPAAGGVPECVTLRDTYTSHVHFKNAALLTLVGAGAVGLGTLTYGLSTRSSRADQRVVVEPLVGASNLGLSVTGAF